jgi:hypothetical protein
MATPATSSTTRSTTLDGVGGSTLSMTEAYHRSLQAPMCSAGRSALVPFPRAFVKYTRETDPALWLNDYRLACQLGSAMMTP